MINDIFLELKIILELVFLLMFSFNLFSGPILDIVAETVPDLVILPFF